MEQHEYYLNETAAKLEQKLNDEIDEITVDATDRFCTFDEKQFDGSLKESRVHKTSVMNKLFNEQNIQYYDVRNFNIQRIAKKGGKTNIISTESRTDTITAGSVGIGLFKTDKKANTSCPALFVVVKIKHGQQVLSEININNIDEGTVFVARYATRIVIGDDEEISIFRDKEEKKEEEEKKDEEQEQKHLCWFGLCNKGSTINLKSIYVAFPAWQSNKDRDIIIYEPISSIISTTKTIYNDIINNKALIDQMPVLSMIIQKTLQIGAKAYPFIDSLSFKLTPSTKHKKKTQNIKIKNKQSNIEKNKSKKVQIKTCPLQTKIKCNYKKCEKSINLNDCFFHQLIHRVDDMEEEKDNDDDIEILCDDSRCYVCGSSGNSQCNLDVKLLENSKLQIITDCLPPNTHIPFKSISMITEKTTSSAWNNPVIKCFKCPGDKSPSFWKWNMEHHDVLYHKNEPPTVKISEFEVAVLKTLSDKNGKCRKKIKQKPFADLCTKYPSETQELFKERYLEVVGELDVAEKEEAD